MPPFKTVETLWKEAHSVHISSTSAGFLFFLLHSERAADVGLKSVLQIKRADDDLRFVAEIFQGLFSTGCCLLFPNIITFHLSWLRRTGSWRSLSGPTLNTMTERWNCSAAALMLWGQLITSTKLSPSVWFYCQGVVRPFSFQMQTKLSSPPPFSHAYRPPDSSMCSDWPS